MDLWYRCPMSGDETTPPVQALIPEPAGRPGTFSKGHDPRRSTAEQRAAGFTATKMRASRRSLAMALRERVPDDVIAEWLIKAAFEGIDPRTTYGPDGLPVRAYPPLTFDQMLKVQQIILERRDGMPAQRIVLEEELKRIAAETEAKPDYSALTDEELEQLRAAQRKAIDAGKARRAAVLGAAVQVKALPPGEKP